MARGQQERQIDRDYRVALAVSDLGEIAAIETRAFAAAAAAAGRPVDARDAAAIDEAIAAVAAEAEGRARELAAITAAIGRAARPARRERREDAEKWLVQGLRDAGGERGEDWEGALALLRELTTEPEGERDPVAWFQLGYLEWQHRGDLAAAAQAFERAQRIGAARPDAYHRASLRHLAHVLALRGDHAAALAALTPALARDDDHDTLFDAARHAARAGRGDLSRDLLRRCLDLRPTTAVVMLAESDLGERAALEALAADHLAAARARAAARLDAWREAAEAAVRSGRDGGVEVDLPPDLAGGWNAARERLAAAGLLEAVAIERAAEQARAAAARCAQKALTAERDRRAAEVVAAKREIAAAEQGVKRAGAEFDQDVARARRDAGAAAPAVSAAEARIAVAVRAFTVVAVAAALVKATVERRPGRFLSAALANLGWAAAAIVVVIAANAIRRAIARRSARARDPRQAAAAARRDERTGHLAGRREAAEARLAAAEAARGRAEQALAALARAGGGRGPDAAP